MIDAVSKVSCRFRLHTAGAALSAEPERRRHRYYLPTYPPPPENADDSVSHSGGDWRPQPHPLGIPGTGSGRPSSRGWGFCFARY